MISQERHFVNEVNQKNVISRSINLLNRKEHRQDLVINGWHIFSNVCVCDGKLGKKKRRHYSASPVS